MNTKNTIMRLIYRSSDYNPDNPSKKQKLDQWFSDFNSDSPQTTASSARGISQVTPLKIDVHVGLAG